jgi:cyclic pyranopterin phosphate synthase
VGAKPVVARVAVAEATLVCAAETIRLLKKQALPKGDVLAVARIAGIQAAKKTSDLIPLCHPLMLTSVSVDLVVRDGAVEIEATVETTGQTGVEMEALTACSVAALTLYDMCKAIDKTMEIGQIALWEKSGGRSGDISR